LNRKAVIVSGAVAVALAILAAVTMTSSSVPVPAAAIPGDVADANNAFAVDFYRQLSADPEEDGRNLFFSPTSMYAAFALLYEGARHDTAAQMQDVFGFEPDAAARHNATAHLMASLNRDDPHATLSMANALWLANGFEPSDSYLDIARNTYVADAERLDLSDPGGEGGAKRINGWAYEKTHGKIREVITQEDLSGVIAMVLTNAIYFKGMWVTQFPAEDTRESDFWRDGTESVKADFMHVTGAFNYTASDGVQVLKMPYKGDRLSMLVILPDGRDGIGALEDAVSADMIEQWRQDLHPGEIVVAMPKFEMKTNYDLGDYLFYLGMTDAFSPDAADLLGIIGIQPGEEYGGDSLYVTRATQDAYVKVNEEGTEAAAVTVITMARESLSLPPSFVADHPFLFLIQDDESGAILFMGRVSDPTA